MKNRLFLILLALLVVVAGGSTYYACTLNQRLDTLNRTLSDYQAAQSGRLSALQDDLTGLEQETGNRLDALATLLNQARDDIKSVNNNLAADEGRLASVEADIANISGNISLLAGRLGATEAKLSSAIFDASAAYAEVSPATVRVTDGANLSGSGFIYDDQRHVVTAYHVVQNLLSIVVITDDGRFFDADIIGESIFSDVAVLELDDDPGIAPPVIGDSTRLHIGDPVAAIGNPLDITDSVTAGVISQVNRFTDYGVGDFAVPNLLQFDAPVNPGNSGGPLVNSAGEVVGVVVARIVAGEGDGIYYAVASNKVKRVADAIIASGSFPYPWLGITISNLSPDEAWSRGLDSTSGVSVGQVDASGPAKTAGILTGDVIVAINGQTTNNVDELTSYLGENLSPGDTAIVTVLRGGASIALSVIIGTR